MAKKHEQKLHLILGQKGQCIIPEITKKVILIEISKNNQESIYHKEMGDFQSFSHE